MNGAGVWGSVEGTGSHYTGLDERLGMGGLLGDSCGRRPVPGLSPPPT